jgi:hypothetical protein
VSLWARFNLGVVIYDLLQCPLLSIYKQHYCKKPNVYESMPGTSAMRSTIVLFVLAFAVFGVLLGFAEVYSNGPERQSGNITMPNNVTVTNSTQGSQVSNITKSG